jgi:hypothetical protein
MNKDYSTIKYQPANRNDQGIVIEINYYFDEQLIRWIERK